MAQPHMRVKYTGSALPGNAETVSLFSTVAAGGSNLSPHHGLDWFTVDIENDETGSIEGYWSVDGGTTWNKHVSQEVAAATASATNRYDWRVDAYRDWKFDWLNDATPQTTFNVNVALAHERSS